MVIFFENVASLRTVPLRGVCEVLDPCVRSGKEQRFVPVVVPADDIRRTSVCSLDLEDLAIPVGFADVVALDHDSITHARAIGDTSFSTEDIVERQTYAPVGPKVTATVAKECEIGTLGRWLRIVELDADENPVSCG